MRNRCEVYRFPKDPRVRWSGPAWVVRAEEAGSVFYAYFRSFAAAIAYAAELADRWRAVEHYQQTVLGR